MILRGVFDPDTVHALAAAAGEYDRHVTGYSRSTTYLGPRHTRIDQIKPATSIQRQHVLTHGDVTNIPTGHALIWDGPTWTLLATQMHWNSPTWQAVTSRRPMPEQRALPDRSDITQQPG